MRRFMRQKLFLFGLIFSLVACHSVANRDDLLLARADSLMQEYPDSALSLLETLSLPQNLPAPQSARYALLLTQAHDKNYITHTDDSLIRIAVHYYDSVGEDVGSRAKAHYYWGRVQQDRKKIPACAREYLIAVSLAETINGDHLLCSAYSNLGYVFYQENLNDKADSCFQQAKLLAQQSNDSARLSLVLVNQGQNYIAKGQTTYPLAEECLTRALVIAEKTENSSMERLATLFLSTLYSRLEDGEKAVEFAKRTIALSNKKRSSGAYLLLGDGYYKLGKYDSAQIYLQKSLQTDSYETQVGAYMRLSDIAEIEKRYEEAILFENFVTAYQDSVSLRQQDAALVSAIKDVQIHFIQKKQAVFFERFSYLFIFLFLALTSLAAFIIYKKKIYHLEALRISKEHEKFTDELGQKSLALEQLQQQLDLRLYEEESAEAQQVREQICILEEERTLILKSLLEHMEVYLKMQKIISYYKRCGGYKEYFGQDDWLHLMASIDPSEHFRKCLMACNGSLFDDEIHLCYLLQIGLSIIDISIVMGCTRDNVYKKKKAVFNKLRTAAENDDLKDNWERVARIF